MKSLPILPIVFFLHIRSLFISLKILVAPLINLTLVEQKLKNSSFFFILPLFLYGFVLLPYTENSNGLYVSINYLHVKKLHSLVLVSLPRSSFSSSSMRVCIRRYVIVCFTLDLNCKERRRSFNVPIYIYNTRTVDQQ